ncbi:hypothetical protein ACSBR1_003658 [Camellia fascicularis]
MTRKISLSSTITLPELQTLYTSDSDEAKQFRTYIRTYNSCFVFTSFGVKYDKELCQRNKGIYTFRIQGQVYHFINEIQSLCDRLSPLQLYFYGTDQEIQHRIQHLEKLRAPIIDKLIQIYRLNPYSAFFRSLTNITELDSLQIIIICDLGLDQRVYNAPSASQIVAIWIANEAGTEFKERDIIVQPVSGHSKNVRCYFGCYDPLQYPLLFPFGEPRWHCGIQRVDKHKGDTTCRRQVLLNLNAMASISHLLQQENEVLDKNSNKRTTITCREYYCYKLQIRPDKRSILLCVGCLFQQYCVNIVPKLDLRLQFFQNNQDSIRADLYQGIIDNVNVGEERASQIGH